MKNVEESIFKTNSDEEKELHCKAMKVLKEFKVLEKQFETQMHTKKISKSTVVNCNRKEKISEYERLYKYKDIVI